MIQTLCLRWILYKHQLKKIKSIKQKTPNPKTNATKPLYALDFNCFETGELARSKDIVAIRLHPLLLQKGCHTGEPNPACGESHAAFCHCLLSRDGVCQSGIHSLEQHMGILLISVSLTNKGLGINQSPLACVQSVKLSHKLQ